MLLSIGVAPAALGAAHPREVPRLELTFPSPGMGNTPHWDCKKKNCISMKTKQNAAGRSRELHDGMLRRVGC